MKTRNFFRNVTALQKGMILILVPLVLEFTVLGFLAKALLDADQKLTQIDHSRQAVLGLVDFANSAELAVCSAMSYDEGQTNQLPALDKLSSLITPDRLGDLNQNSDPELNGTFQSLKTLVEKLRDFDRIIRPVFEKQAANPEFRYYLPKPELISALVAFRRFFHQVVQIESLVLGTEPEKLRGLRLQLIYCLISVVLLSLTVSLMLSWFFTSDITNRLRRIANNAICLSTGKPLPIPEGGNDEIAQLENILYHSSAELMQLRRKEFVILDNAADVICSLDENLTFVDVSAAVTMVWNRPKEALLGQSLMTVLEETHADDTATAFRQIADRLGSGEVENRVRCASGFVKDSLWKVSWSATDRRFFCVVHDVTELRAIEKLKHQFLQIVCHDLRSPLMSIGIDVNLLIADKNLESHADDIEGELSKLSVNLGYLNSLVSEFLELEQLESRTVSMEMMVVSASDLCVVAKESLETLATRTQIQIELPEGDGLIWGNEKALIQAVTKLLANAIDVSPPTAKVQIRISVNNHLVRIKVTDQSQQIPREKREFVFEKLRLPAHEGPGRKGMELGLVIVKNIASSHGGSVGVESEPSGGTSLWIELPEYLHEPEDTGEF